MSLFTAFMETMSENAVYGLLPCFWRPAKESAEGPEEESRKSWYLYFGRAALATVALQLFIVGYWWVTIKSGQEALGLSDAAVGAQSAIILNVLTAVLFTDPLFDLVKRLVCCKKAPQGGDDNTTRLLDH